MSSDLDWAIWTKIDPIQFYYGVPETLIPSYFGNIDKLYLKIWSRYFSRGNFLALLPFSWLQVRNKHFTFIWISFPESLFYGRCPRWIFLTILQFSLILFFPSFPPLQKYLQNYWLFLQSVRAFCPPFAPSVQDEPHTYSKFSDLFLFPPQYPNAAFLTSFPFSLTAASTTLSLTYKHNSWHDCCCWPYPS